MKTFSYIAPYIIALVLLAYIITDAFENKKEFDLKQSEINHLRDQNKIERDSLTRNLVLVRDSLSNAYTLIRNAHAESEKAKIVSQREITKLKGIIFVQYASDSARIKALVKLYPSFKPQ